MMFALGIAAFGAARFLTGGTWRGLATAGFGMWLAALVRPHVAGIIAVALIGGYLFKPAREESRELAPVVKGLSLVVLAAVAVVLAVNTDRFLRESGIDTGGGATSVLDQVTTRTAQGGSGFAPSILQSPTRAPIAIGTVLFRPVVTEAHNAQALAAALESTFLLGFAAYRFRWFWAAIRSSRHRPYVAFALIYTATFVFAFSGLANFGILARQRVQMLPFLLLLFSIPPPSVENAADRVST